VVSHPCDKDKNVARMGHPWVCELASQRARVIVGVALLEWGKLKTWAVAGAEG